MKKFIVSAALGAGALLLATSANAAPLINGVTVMPDNGIENVRMVCDEFGRCYRTHGGRRVIIERDYDDGYYAPRERYIERRGYYDSGPSVGVGVGPVGVGVGFGRW